VAKRRRVEEWKSGREEERNGGELEWWKADSYRVDMLAYSYKSVVLQCHPLADILH